MRQKAYGEVEARRLDLRSALFEFCTRRLGMSESEACRRIEAARLVKRFPCLLEGLERGDLHVTGQHVARQVYLRQSRHEAVDPTPPPPMPELIREALHRLAK